MEIKDGDYFSYSWKIGRGPSTDPYWCRDRRCVAKELECGIVMFDTYNYCYDYCSYDEGSEEIFSLEALDRDYTKIVDTEAFDLEFICNLNDYEIIKYDYEDYEGVLSCGYQCTKRYMKPKGSEKSNNMILEKLKRQLGEAEYQKKSAQWDIERITQQMEDLK